tara:strand:- start:210 stop:452 length:243 start_codon:yes stop_codon:yes gene_type:complete
MKIFLNTTDLNNPTIEITKTYEVGVEVIENPSKEPNKITYTTYEVEATSEYEASRKASDLCGKEFLQNPYAIELPYIINE